MITIKILLCASLILQILVIINTIFGLIHIFKHLGEIRILIIILAFILNFIPVIGILYGLALISIYSEQLYFKGMDDFVIAPQFKIFNESKNNFIKKYLRIKLK